jgi:UDP-N-acetylglucosamine--dolichyl-phosphate N-acetylglucosaminephosphotransferase
MLPPYVLFAVLPAFAIAALSLPKLIEKLRAAGITEKDMHKAGSPQIPEMGGISIVMGAVGALLLVIGAHTFFEKELGLGINVPVLMATLTTMLIIALIGIFDDLFDMSQRTKALLPIVSAIPLAAVQSAGSTAMTLPFLGVVDFGGFYLVLLVPLAVTVCSNLTNMLAGFNGLEAGMGIVMFAALSLIAFFANQPDMAVISLSMLGALCGFLIFNWAPARAFPGDVGTLVIGAGVAAAVITGSYESAGVIIMLPYIADFFIKAANGFPKTFGTLRNGKLYCDKRPAGVVQYVMKLSGGISEKGLVLALIATECIFAAVALALYVRV